MDCYKEAIAIDSDCSEAWCALGKMLSIIKVACMGSVIVGYITYTKKDCFVKALTHRIDYKYAWRYLGDVMTNEDTVTIKGVPYTKEDCFFKGSDFSSDDDF